MARANPMSQCDLLLDAGFQDLILLPDSDAYTKREASYWAATARLQPSCIIQPRTSEDVSRIVKVLANADGPVAVRSGGHTQWPGSNNVHGGVTIDLGLMTDVSYDAQSNLALVQPGSRWGDVYKKLLDHSVCVAGGRDGNVGIGGFLTGGGLSYHAGLYGLACDTVANFEIVVASGDVVHANATSNSDLWTALKGGSGNFGIVTRFDMHAFPAQDVWGGIRVATRQEGDKLARSMVDFTNNVEKNPEDAYILIYTYGPDSPDILVPHAVIDTSGVANASAFSEIQKIPVIVNDVKERSVANLVDSYLGPGNQQVIWFSLTFRNDVEVIKKAADMHDELVDELKVLMPGDFTTQCLFQPMPTVFAQRSVERGGNVLGLDKVKENALLWLLTGSTKTPEQHAIMRDKLDSFAATLKEFAHAKNLNVDWQYLNYVDQTQNPLKSYGEDNVEFIRKVAAKYDPSAMFQKKVVSGWKISAVDA
ncbi:hypothetical protein FB567DRAFT_206280 [Paraphoma chrysanthemicola]|uniref:FAD-binding PCMH-type domain-containing protein n=1 Tax=Paraphoma chrysanthemicola TaxID=798071 RepID=A0A8K0QV17_9PLEO|nr:hypothetical protein FB567DRAFT_206280 [Paraphoma chrysanthemicola]